VEQSGPLWRPIHTQAVDYFNRFFQPLEEVGQSLFELLVDETNKYYRYKRNSIGVLKEWSRLWNWTDVTEYMMKAFIGVTLNMGLLKKSSIESYWDSTHYSQSTPFFSEIFRLDTYKLLLSCFHASDRDQEPKKGSADYSPCYKFEKVLSHLNRTWYKEYIPDQNISIDESLVPFKGRHDLVNYNRMKKHANWGPTEYLLADSKNGYIIRTKYHVNGQPKSAVG
jgi:hypothetical protein